LTAVTIAGFYLLGYRPATARLVQFQTTTLARQQELRANQTKASRRNDIATKNERLRIELDQIKKPSKQQEFPDLIKELSRCSDQNSLKSFSYKPGTQVPSELFMELPLTLTFEGDGVSVFNFLRTTEQM